ncbi:MAG: hypothetical protein U5J99_12765 [Parvularculaceae bacterium]|nr:hypothetical protein [Parvularculaceae bacterium]
MTLKAQIFALAYSGVCMVAAPAAAETANPVAAASAAALDSYFAGVESAAPSSVLGAQADYEAFAKALGDRASLTFGSFTAEGGGAIARDVLVTIGDKKDAGLKIAELRLYPAGAKGVRGDVTVERIDAKGLSTFGLEAVIEQATNAYTKAIVEGVEGAAGGDIEAGAKAALDAAPQIAKYDVAIDRMVLDGFILHAPDKATAKTAAAGDEFAELLRIYAAAGRATSARAMILRGTKAEMTSTSAGVQSKLKMAIDFVGQRGVARGDLEASVMSGLTFDMDAATDAKDGAPALPVAFSGGVERYSVTGLKLAKLLGFWARGESPSPKETDLLSLGVWESVNERYTFGGEPFYSLDRARTDMTKFRWFLPTSIRGTATNLSYDLGGFLKFSAKTAPQTEGAPNMNEMIALLEKHGFSKITVSGETDYNWSPETGLATLVTKNDMKTMGQVNLDLGAGFPTFKEFASLHPKKGEAVDPAKVSALVAETSLADASIAVADKGLLLRGFALAADMQAAQAGMKPGAVKGEDLRAAAAFSMRSLGTAPTPLAPMYAAIADFIAEGGTLSVTAAPASPIPFSLIMVPGPNGEDPLTRLNLKATRTAN